MTTYPSLQAGIEVSFGLKDFTFPWILADLPALTSLRLSAQNIPAEVGLIVAELISYNSLESSSDVDSRLRSIIDHPDQLIISGGLSICDGQQIIAPSCCCGLETWRDWVNFAATGQSPCMGHDPNPWAEILDTKVLRIWSEEGPKKFCIDFTLPQFNAALSAVHQDLIGFLEPLAAWANELGFAEADRLVAAFDRHFHTSGPLV